MPASKMEQLNRGNRVRMNPMQFVRNLAMARNDHERTMLLRALEDPLERDIDKKCKYPEHPDVEDYQRAYDRHDIAARVIRLYPDECWKMRPEVYETEDLETETPFEKAFNQLEIDFHIYSKIHDLDRLSGIGRFGVLLVGISDGKSLDKPVANLNARGDVVADEEYKLTFLRAFSESSVKVKELETDFSNPRYGQPTKYEITFIDPKSGLSATKDSTSQTLEVHWSRVIHAVDNREGSDVFGIPRLQQVFNRIYDLRKVLGASGEGYWKGGFPGISAETHPNIEAPDIDIEATREEIYKYFEEFQRALISEGMTMKTLNVAVGDPTPHFRIGLEALSICLEVPMRVFMGTEEGKLASGQDMRLWNSRVMGRQQLYVNPYLIIPFINRLVAFRILPKPKTIIIKWPDLNAPTDNDKATHTQKLVEAIVKYVTAGASQLIAPKDFLVDVCLFDVETADRILANASKYTDLPLAEEILAPPDTGPTKQPGKSEGAGRE